MIPRIHPRSILPPTDPVISVAGERWQAVPTLAGHGPDARVYLLHTGANGEAHLVFGDGVTGRRPPAGLPITISYRTGGGQGGNAVITTPPGGAGFTVQAIPARGVLHVRHTRHRHH